MADFRSGQVVLVRFPFTNLRTAKLRPAIVLSTHGEDIVVVGVFSSLPPSLKNTWLLIEEKGSYFRETGLKKSSVVKGEKVATLHRSVIHLAIGRLPQNVFDAVRERVKIALNLP